MLFETDEALIVMFLGIILFFAKKFPVFACRQDLDIPSRTIWFII